MISALVETAHLTAAQEIILGLVAADGAVGDVTGWGVVVVVVCVLEGQIRMLESTVRRSHHWLGCCARRLVFEKVSENDKGNKRGAESQRWQKYCFSLSTNSKCIPQSPPPFEGDQAASAPGGDLVAL